MVVETDNPQTAPNPPTLIPSNGGEEPRTASLWQQLEEEKARNQSLVSTIAHLRTSTATLLDACEQAQEGISNRLLREIDRLKASQLEMCDAVERGEARLVDMLAERVRLLQREKIALENALECEQERIVNKLQRQMDVLRLAAGMEETVGTNGGGSPPLSLQEQIRLAVAHHIEREGEFQRQMAKLQEENQALAVENLNLKHRLRRMSIEDASVLSDSSLSNSPSANSHMPLPHPHSHQHQHQHSHSPQSHSHSQSHMSNASPPPHSRSRSRGSISDLRRSGHSAFPSESE